MNRECGVLLAISSLPGPYGIGDFGKEAYNFIDFLENSGQNLWQVLPLCPIEFGNSPYQSSSTFAGNFLYLDLEDFVKNDYLTWEDINTLRQEVSYINYNNIKSQKKSLLEKAAKAFFCKMTKNNDFENFKKENNFWLKDYANFIYLNEKFKGKIWNSWQKEYKFRDKKILKEIEIEAKEIYNYESFIQYHFWKQWKKIKKYANEKGIKIIGDLPIYAATHSSDTWQNPKLFSFDKHLKIKKIAGCPPDYFSKEGQLWGNVLYDWQAMEKQNYSWWIKRIKYCFKLYDILRLDHFRGFASYWAVRFGEKTAINGKWEKGPRYKFFQKLESKIKSLDIIAEDLGTLTPDVFKLLEQTKYPNMRVLQFGLLENNTNMYHPDNYVENSVAYTGTHDNPSMVEWYETLSDYEKYICDENLKNFLNTVGGNIWEPIQWRAIETLYATKSARIIIPMQDILGLGKDSRMNIPSTVGNNWQWRVYENYRHSDLENKLKELTIRYKRNNEE